MAMEIKKFAQYVKEQVEATLDTTIKLKGYTSAQIIDRITQLMDVLSDSVRFGVPSDNLGRSTTYRDANGAIQKIKDMQHYYDSKGEEVRFYCWSIEYAGSWKATQNLKAKIDSAGGFGEEKLNMNLKKVIDYFTTNAEDSDNVRSIAISMDSKSIREATGRTKEPSEAETKEAPTEPNQTEATSGEQQA